jgi:hypothetical protein
VLDLAINGYVIKLLFDLIDPTNRRHPILLLRNSNGAPIKQQESFPHAHEGNNLLLSLADNPRHDRARAGRYSGFTPPEATAMQYLTRVFRISLAVFYF